MASLELTQSAVGCAFETLLMGPLTATFEYSERQRQSAGTVTGQPCVGRVYIARVTAEMPVSARQAAKASRTCKLLHSVYRALYTERRKTELMAWLWDRFSDIVVREVLDMNPWSSLTCCLLFKGDLEHLSVCAEHQDMEAVQGGTRAPVLDASGAVAWPGVRMRIAVRYTPYGLLTVLPENRAAAGEPDSRTHLLRTWLNAHKAGFELFREQLSVLEHP